VHYSKHFLERTAVILFSQLSALPFRPVEAAHEKTPKTPAAAVGNAFQINLDIVYWSPRHLTKVVSVFVHVFLRTASTG
jgi:hypothetical protein